MGKEKIEVVLKVDELKDTTKELLMFIKEMADAENEKEESKKVVKEDAWKAEKEMVRKEFIRVMKLLEKEKPGTDTYITLTRSLRELKSVTDYWT